MKTRLNRMKLKEKLNEVSKCKKTKKQNLNLKSKAEQSKASLNVLPDQQELFFDFRPCCVKVKRIKQNVLPSKSIQNKNPAQPKELQGQRTSTVATASDNDDVVESTKTNKKESEMNSSKRYTFRNPGLSLTQRKAREMGLRKSLDVEAEKTKENRHGTIENCTPLEPNKNSTIKTSTALLTHPGKESDMSKIIQRNSSLNRTSKPSEISENLLIKSKKVTRSAPLSKVNELKSRGVAPKSSAKRDRKSKKTSIHKESSNECDIYEFLSQSQTSDSDADKHKDPAADIIKKLIEQGKVAVTKNRNGKPFVIYKKKKKPNQKKYQPTLKKTKNPLNLHKGFQPKHAIILEEEETDNHDHFDGDLGYPDPENNEVMLLISDDAKVSDDAKLSDDAKVSDNAMKRNTKSNTAATNQGTFSNLARSVLMQQTNQTNSARKSIIDKKRLLEITQQYVSTPLQKSRASLQTHDANLSPIPKTTVATNSNIFRNTSARTIDFVDNASFMPSLPIDTSDSPQNHLSSTRRSIRDTGQQSSLSSFSSNDSNAENIPPPSRVQLSQHNDENAIIFNSRQVLNPRRTLGNRSPLKTINIIDVITLPPHRGHINADKKDDEGKKPEESNELSFLPQYSDVDTNESCEKSNNEALFGFEEYLDEDQDISSENINNTTTSSINLHKELKKLKKWRPKAPRNNDAKSSTITKCIFDDDFNKKKGQKDIRNLLCSTMINPTTTRRTTLPLNESNDDSDETVTSTSDRNKALDLFGDPESTFDQKSLHRTYERPFKRKRKLLHQYSVVLDSEDESEHEDGDHNTSIKKGAKRQKKNRNHREIDENPELDKFISEFNSILKEAEEYELIIE